MGYLFFFISFIIITFLGTMIFSSVINKDKDMKSKIKFSMMLLSFILPIVSIVSCILFLVFIIIKSIMGVDINNFNLLIISMLGVVIIFSGEILSKKIVAEIAAKKLFQKYKEIELSEEEKFNIVTKIQEKYRKISLVIMGIINMICYLAILSIMRIEASLIFIALLSIVTLIAYVLGMSFGKRKSVTQ
ncbi:hypothetical protein [Clostridium thermobutyricum]|uniref:hypothetical protein n=1 Tax=Clostridium thermobutyricum TaxID=29372 RepID=UPI0018AB820C|nr:hypothetical protein [Clostridium thermobutyricum]